MRTRITTNLDRDAVLNSMRDLIAGSAGLSGAVTHNQVALAYRSFIMVPGVRVAAFLGRVVNARNGAIIEGRVETGIDVWLLGGVVGALFLSSFFVAISWQKYSFAGLTFLIGAAGVLLVIGRVRSARRFLVDELCRASRGERLAVGSGEDHG